MIRIIAAVLFFAYLAPAQTVTTITAAGAGSWTAPAGVTSIKVECIGGGGGGATMTSNGGGGGGGGGAYAERMAVAVTPGVIYNYTVGAAGQTNGGVNGGATTFTGDGGVQCIAAGGTSKANNSTTSGAGGLVASSTGDVVHVFAGGNGAAGVTGSYGGGGGSSGGSASAGNTATNASGATAITGGGPGGAGKTSPQGAGNAPANGPGGGGGGGLRTSSGTRSGGAGWAGQITITYNTMTTAVSDGVLLASSVIGQYNNNSAKTASVVENIQHVPSTQSRWGQSPAQVLPTRDLGGRGFNKAVTERNMHTASWFGIVPAQNYATDVTEHIQHVPSNQTRLGMSLPLSHMLSSSAAGSQAGALHLTAFVVENIPYVPATSFEWGAEPSVETVRPSIDTSQSYTPGGPPSVPVPRRPAVIR